MKRKVLMLLLMAAVLTVFFATLTSASTIVKSWNISATSKDNVIARLYADEVNEEMYILTISGTGNMKDWAFDSPNCAPWYYSYKSQITAVTIENGITNIGEYAFYWCSSLTDIVIPNSIVSIENSALSNCKKLINIEVDENNQYFCDVDGVLYTKNKSTLIKYPAGKQEDSFSVLNSVITIGNSAFYDCKNLENITISNSVTTIGDSAFYNCGLKSLIIPNKITRIEGNTFRYCSQLTKITIPKNIEFIGYYAFDGCRNLTIYCEAESQSNEWNGGWNPNNRPVVWNYKVTMLNNSFEFLGYSAREDGTGAICASYEIDYETIELYEYLTGERNEAIVSAVRPLIVKFSSAFKSLLTTLILICSGLYILSQDVSNLETQRNLFNDKVAKEVQLSRTYKEIRGNTIKEIFGDKS